jgi:hypothetical protein
MVAAWARSIREGAHRAEAIGEGDGEEERTVLAYMRRGSGGYATREFRPSADVPRRTVQNRVDSLRGSRGPRCPRRGRDGARPARSVCRVAWADLLASGPHVIAACCTDGCVCGARVPRGVRAAGPLPEVEGNADATGPHGSVQ